MNTTAPQSLGGLRGNVPTPAISVIVPVYKAEKYLRKCVDSLLAQTFTDFELLLVDDGSPDRSGEICDGYAARDPRVRTFHKKNGGVSSARQCGIDNACGEYTIHADPDDWVEPDMLETLYNKAKEEDADMVICDYILEFPSKSIPVYYQLEECSPLLVFQKMTCGLSCALWNKMVRRSCYDTGNVLFPVGCDVFEDLFVNASLLLKSVRRVAYVHRPLYHYTQQLNENSLFSRFTLEKLLQEREVTRGIEHLLGGRCQLAVDNLRTIEAYICFYHHFLSSSYFRRYYASEMSSYKRSSVSHMQRFVVVASASGWQWLIYPFYSLLRKLRSMIGTFC